MHVSLAHVVRTEINHHRDEALSARKRAGVARTVGDVSLAERLEAEIKRATHGAAALEQALGMWLHRNARVVREQLEGAQGE